MDRKKLWITSAFSISILAVMWCFLDLQKPPTEHPVTSDLPDLKPQTVIFDTLRKNPMAEVTGINGLDSNDFQKRVRALAHDSIPKPWQVFSIYPENGAILPFYRIVAMYGNFYSKHMGILGRIPEEELLALYEEELRSWNQADSLTPSLPAVHYIAITAQKDPGKEGWYRLRMPENQIQKAIQLGRALDGITFLDVQVGHSTVEREIPTLEKYLIEKDVHLGIDPEWSMKDGSVPGTKIGTLDAADINFAIEYLTHLVKENGLPPKVLVVHRFTRNMITNYQEIKATPQVQVVINMDGFGFPAKKVDSYRGFVGGMPVQFTGIKLFYLNDKLTPPYRLMTPAEILKLYPKPIYIQYQ
ncbi:MAG: hypothetical protein ACJLTB_04870 [Algoriphagus aquaeductus]|uniref:hypothetical protein n=1 Tax=Algoriphagus aquaeductus TaxID=475299 RepID=UPI003879B596